MALHVARLCLLTAIGLLAPALARAQDASPARDSVGPRAGSWGAELGVGATQTATLLRFHSPRTAMLLGAEVAWTESREEISTGTGSDARFTYTYATIAARLGVRQYAAVTASPMRPFTSAGVLAAYLRDPGGSGWAGGAFGELGASYFFSPHASLGATGGLQASYTTRRQEGASGLSRHVHEFSVRASTVRVLAAVYF